ncbi:MULTISPECIES: Gfo/Idh/MocA family oxidoreductase [Sinorhizobium]|uniref:Gfo/Idh/MocA family protein n=1 Tax=Sinorhizobium TaxID=28105 RepID=UPI000BE95F5C|nr:MULTISPECIES: Gfo/Idh/MocA family oxidoreductase [Sinorhizobium]PDT51231.1 oxidoreductase [Sinorhizobium sp. NG07B]
MELRQSAVEGWAVMGTGTIATEQMVTAIRAIGHSPLWVVSKSKTDALHFANDLDIPQATTDMERIWSDPAVKFVYISATLKRRQHYVLAAADAGKHILCDGPLSEDSKTARRLIKHCSDNGVVLAVNQPLRASAIHQTMHRLILDGEIGTIQSVSILRGGPFQPPPNRRGEISCDRGSVFLHICAEDIDLARFLTGGEPLEAIAFAKESNGSPHHLAYTIRMDDGSFLQAHESFGTADMESMVVAAGTDGVLLASGTLSSRGSGVLVRRLAGRNELVPVRDRDLHTATLEEFVAAARHQASPLATGRDSFAALVATEAVASAAKRGRATGIRPFDESA